MGGLHTQALATPSARNRAAVQNPISKSVPTKLRHAFVLGAILAAFLLIECFIPLSTAVRVGADEGFNLAKATLCLKGHKLYSEIWNDQPPLHTIVLTKLLAWQQRLNGSSELLVLSRVQNLRWSGRPNRFCSPGC